MAESTSRGPRGAWASGRGLSRALAVVLPLGVLGLAAVLLAAPVPAGPASAAARALDARLAGDPVDVVVLGNSKVGTDLDPDALAALLPGTTRVVPLGVNGTGAAVWYAVLQHRVYGGGHAPRVVIVYGTLRMMLEAELPFASQRAAVADQLAAPDPVLQQKIFGGGRDPRLQRILDRRTPLRQAWTEALRDEVVGALLAGPGDGSRAARGHETATPALARLFGAETAVATRHLPVAEPGAAPAPAALRPVDETLVPELITLAHTHDAQIIFVRAPLGSPKRATDEVPDASLQAFVALLDAQGAGWVDLHDALPDAAFGDGAHLTDAGRATFTPRLTAALRGLGVGTPTLAAPVRPVARPTFKARRDGAGPTLPALTPTRGPGDCGWTSPFSGFAALSDAALAAAGWGALSPIRVREDTRLLTGHGDLDHTATRCTGTATVLADAVRFSPTGSDPAAPAGRTYRATVDPDLPLAGPAGAEAWWVYPGTRLRFELPDPPGGRVQVRAWAAVPGSAAATLRIGALSAPLHPTGGRLEAELDAPDAAPWSLTLTSPEDGPWLLLDTLTVGDRALVGRPGEARRVALLRVTEPIASAPRPIPTPPGTWVRAAWNSRSWVLPLPDLAVPATEEVFSRMGANCSPLRMWADGRRAAVTPEERAAPGVDKLMHAHRRVQVDFTPDRDPNHAVQDLRFGLDPERRCVGEARWVYPGDTWTLRPAAPTSLRAGATSVYVSGGAFGDAGTLTVVVRVGGQERGRQGWPITGFTSGEVALSAPILPGDADVEVEVLSTPDAGYLLLNSVDLVEPG